MDRALAPWPTPELERIGKRAAVIISRLIVTERTWIRRRVETFAFVDGFRVTRSMSIDFVTPQSFVRESRGVFLIPVAMPKKDHGPLRDLKIVDEDDRTLPILTREENASVASAVLRAQALETLDATGWFEGLELDVALDLADIAGAAYGTDDRLPLRRSKGRASRAILRFRDAMSVTTSGTVADLQRQVLWGDALMRSYIELLWTRYLLIVRLRAQPGDRRIVKLSYEEYPHLGRVDKLEHINLLTRIWRRRSQTVGWGADVIEFRTRALYAASAYHAEIAVPEDLVIATASLNRAIDYTDSESLELRAARDIDLDSKFNVQLAHLYSSGLVPGERTNPVPMNQDVSEFGWLRIHIRLRHYVVFPPLVISAVTTAMLATGLLLRWGGVTDDQTASTSLLVAVPGVVAAYLIPSGHHLVRRLFVGMRLLIAVSSTISFVAAAVLALQLPTRDKAGAWGLLGVLSLAVTLSLCVAWKESLQTR